MPFVLDEIETGQEVEIIIKQPETPQDEKAELAAIQRLRELEQRIDDVLYDFWLKSNAGQSFSICPFTLDYRTKQDRGKREGRGQNFVSYKVQKANPNWQTAVTKIRGVFSYNKN